MDSLTDQILAYEADELEFPAALELFSALVKSGMAWTFLQGHYGRTAKEFIRRGYLDESGEILSYDQGDINDPL